MPGAEEDIIASAAAREPRDEEQETKVGDDGDQRQPVERHRADTISHRGHHTRKTDLSTELQR